MQAQRTKLPSLGFLFEGHCTEAVTATHTVAEHQVDFLKAKVRKTFLFGNIKALRILSSNTTSAALAAGFLKISPALSPANI